MFRSTPESHTTLLPAQDQRATTVDDLSGSGDSTTAEIEQLHLSMKSHRSTRSTAIEPEMQPEHGFWL